jgi:hypothetical protein
MGQRNVRALGLKATMQGAASKLVTRSLTVFLDFLITLPVPLMKCSDSPPP